MFKLFVILIAYKPDFAVINPVEGQQNEFEAADLKEIQELSLLMQDN